MKQAVTLKFKGGKSKFTLLDKIKTVQSTYARVGFPKELKASYPNGKSVIEVAIANEVGATIENPGGVPYGYQTEEAAHEGQVRFMKKGEGFMELGRTKPSVIHIPSRPFMQVTAIKMRDTVKQAYVNIANFVLQKGQPIDGPLGALAAKYVSWIQATITEFRDPHNAPSTIAQKKGVDNPLIDTGIMRQSVMWVVDHA